MLRTDRVGSVGLLLFGSGMCALIYQTVWLRQFRLIFGASTASSAAVLAIFMAGLGFGGILLGRIADRSRRPLALYGFLEVGIALFTALTPVLLWAVRAAYLATGGSVALGMFVATVLRLLLATLILAVPTLLMGGTLPAAARAVESDDDLGRRRLGWLYGLNTLGAVTGVLLSTFFLLERFGSQYTLWLACLVNLMVALVAISIAKNGQAPDEIVGAPNEIVGAPVSPPARAGEDTGAPYGGAAPQGAPRAFVLPAAAIVGFAFLLMELVWYRMLAPLLGGTTFTFGLILATALLGIGLGGVAYSAGGNRRASISVFALTCALEAVFIAIPYALGDRVAVLALLSRSIGGLGFGGYMIGWAGITFIVVFPAAFMAGIQFPILIGLLGRGRESVGRDTGVAVFWNTLGAIAGSIAGGFGLLPLLGATRTWRAVVIVLAALALVALVLSVRRRVMTWPALAAAGAAVIAFFLLAAPGPSAAWRHTPIGAGRADQEKPTRNKLKNFINSRKRAIFWDVDGVESTVGLSRYDGVAFIVNGKSDGHAILDGGTQVMGGLLVAALHPNPKSAFVIGLGTGTTAGWLGAVPGIERVDVAELEPSIDRVARECAAVNREPLENPKVKVFYGDGREMLLTSRRRYDLISSEPSNPYRAGISSLLTVEFYRAVTERLAEGGLFCQFLQAYEIDGATLRMIYGTMTTVFPHVETWETRRGDLLLVGAMQPPQYQADALRKRFDEEPYRSAIRSVWRAQNLEGVLAHYVAGDSTSRTLASGAQLNTDDRPNVEYAFARTLGNNAFFQINDLRALAKQRSDDTPSIEGVVNLGSIEDQRLALITSEAAFPPDMRTLNPDQQLRARAYIGFVQQDYESVLRSWVYQKKRPSEPTELLTFAEAYADRGDDAVLPYIDELRAFSAVEADLVLARLLARQQKNAEAAAALSRAFVAHRSDPWPLPLLVSRALELAADVSAGDRAVAASLYKVLREPFAARSLDVEREYAALRTAAASEPSGCGPAVIEALQTFESAPPWDGPFLRNRAQCYEQANHPRAVRARLDLMEYLKNEPLPLAGR
ncbi:MAG TPA: fused MFS/spermidine synthase [Thermoanaerobaculia bacterium]|nr:fused MFS/spermidine synthase [Thermoanaerobaculia bacterium]